MGLDDVESGRVENRAQLSRGPTVRADDRVVEWFNLDAVEVAEKEGTARAEDSREFEQRRHDL